MIECIVFDLDGTLVNSHNTIYKATIKTLEYLNLKSNLNKDKFYNMISMTLKKKYLLHLKNTKTL